MACSSLLSDDDLRRFRTKPCRRHHQQMGRCEFGPDRCQYSHSEPWPRRCPFYLSHATSIRYVPRVCPHVTLGEENDPSLRTIGTVLSNKCTRGGSCPFAHSVEEVLYHPLHYKTKVCPFFLRGECTTYYCPFIHGTAERRDVTATKYSLPFSNGIFKTSPFPNVEITSRIPPATRVSARSTHHVTDQLAHSSTKAMMNSTATAHTLQSHFLLSSLSQDPFGAAHPSLLSSLSSPLTVQQEEGSVLRSQLSPNLLKPTEWPASNCCSLESSPFPSSPLPLPQTWGVGPYKVHSKNDDHPLLLRATTPSSSSFENDKTQNARPYYAKASSLSFLEEGHRNQQLQDTLNNHARHQSLSHDDDRDNSQQREQRVSRVLPTTDNLLFPSLVSTSQGIANSIPYTEDSVFPDADLNQSILTLLEALQVDEQLSQPSPLSAVGTTDHTESHPRNRQVELNTPTRCGATVDSVTGMHGDAQRQLPHALGHQASGTVSSRHPPHTMGSFASTALDPRSATMDRIHHKTMGHCPVTKGTEDSPHPTVTSPVCFPLSCSPSPVSQESHGEEASQSGRRQILQPLTLLDASQTRQLHATVKRKSPYVVPSTDHEDDHDKDDEDGHHSDVSGIKEYRNRPIQQQALCCQIDTGSHSRLQLPSTETYCDGALSKLDFENSSSTSSPLEKTTTTASTLEHEEDKHKEDSVGHSDGKLGKRIDSIDAILQQLALLIQSVERMGGKTDLTRHTNVNLPRRRRSQRHQASKEFCMSTLSHQADTHLDHHLDLPYECLHYDHKDKEKEHDQDRLKEIDSWDSIRTQFYKIFYLLNF